AADRRWHQAPAAAEHRGRAAAAGLLRPQRPRQRALRGRVDSHQRLRAGSHGGGAPPLRAGRRLGARRRSWRPLTARLYFTGPAAGPGRNGMNDQPPGSQPPGGWQPPGGQPPPPPPGGGPPPPPPGGGPPPPPPGGGPPP